MVTHHGTRYAMPAAACGLPATLWLYRAIETWQIKYNVAGPHGGFRVEHRGVFGGPPPFGLKELSDQALGW
jgi:hypothetical protein